MLSRIILLKNGSCCGNGCLMCPYYPRHSGNTKIISKKVYKDLDDLEIIEIKKQKIKLIINDYLE